MNKRQCNTVEVIRFRRFARKSFSAFRSMQKVITIGFLSGCTLINAHAASVNPEEKIRIATSLDSISEGELDEVVVTATKVELPSGIAAKQVTIVGRTEIEQAPVKSVQDLLNYVAVVDLLQRSPHGVQADISLRGGSADQVAILLNGVNLTNPQTGHYSLDIPVNLSDIERIEIVQGPTSLAYGASAMSGGINIITKKDTASNAFAKLEGGMYGLFGAELRGSYRAKHSTHSLSVGYGRSDGYIRNSDYNIFNSLLQSRFVMDDRATIDFQFGFNAKKYGANTFYSAAYPNQYDDTKGVFASVRGETKGKLKFIPQIYWSSHYDCFQLIREGTPDVPAWYKDHNYHRSDLFGISLNAQYSSRFGITSFGGEVRNEGILSSVLGNAMPDTIGKYTKSYNRTNINYFAEHNVVLDRLTISVGGILNYNTAIANTFRFYPAINASYRPSDRLSLYASWDMATRMPTFTELFYTTRTHVSDAKLLPEYTRSAEIGFRYYRKALTISGSTFYSIGENLIDWIYNEADSKWHSVNVAKGYKLSTVGINGNVVVNMEEFAGKNQPFNTLRLGYQHITQNNNSADGTQNPISQYVFNYLKHKITATLNHDIVKNLSMTWTFRWQDREGSYTQYIDLRPAERVDYKPFFILDIKVDYALKGFNLFVAANNIFDNTYVDFGNIPQPGFWLTGGVSYRFR